MDPVTASGVITIGKQLISNVATSLKVGKKHSMVSFKDKLENSQPKRYSIEDPNLLQEKLQIDLKSELLKNPETASFLERNENNQIFIEKRADGSIQFISSSGESLVLDQYSTECSKALEFFDVCIQNNINLTAMRPNAVIFNS
tara:strand:- start:1451 stop:1882 length:432 start_codon:yes stop_codon:yes gene_type:complete